MAANQGSEPLALLSAQVLRTASQREEPMNRVVVHPDFKELTDFVADIPQCFDALGTSIYKVRNELRACSYGGFRLVIKSYALPNVVNRLVYGHLRASKAERAYRYGLLLREAGFGSPQPVAFVTGKGLFFGRSFFVSLESALPYTYKDLQVRDFPRLHDILLAVARNAAALHNAGFHLLDYTQGNILFDDRPEEIRIELVDLNRMSFGRVGVKTGCRDLQRLEKDTLRRKILIEEYLHRRL
jgi:hypothetical protein